MTENVKQESIAPKPKRRSRAANEERILAAAEDVFAQHGYQGAAIDAIAERSGLSKQNMLYYFPSKEVLYKRVLQNILDLWLDKMALLEQEGDDPKAMLSNYIRGKIELSRIHPNGSKVFANEIINGATRLKEYLQSHLLPQLEADVQLIRQWIAEGKMDPIDPYHLFFVIWSSTQTYADFSTQIELALDKPKLEKQDYDDASDFLIQLVLKGTGVI
ncbi:TetR/AcrR family transcriptional regulator [Motiliproteus sp. MSK22-1]|uniref:TetR/AcrR family transcriptional regulator n=1 Tax=Motiliproteus sp. MSK22-1 TaxID=1897630 RepID=UPI0009777EE5|nr:TetR/AcrR family transcriptional regulator [Motiliproteus sp. MSK22-1]OMH39399.1 TetR family transcriptional regulator [Motiliproteus sp. MSK22-1]